MIFEARACDRTLHLRCRKDCVIRSACRLGLFNGRNAAIADKYESIYLDNAHECSLAVLQARVVVLFNGVSTVTMDELHEIAGNDYTHTASH